MNVGKFLLTAIVAAVVFAAGWLVGSSIEQSEADRIQTKTDYVFSYIKNEYPEQWSEIQASRPWIEYDIAVNGD